MTESMLVSGLYWLLCTLVCISALPPCWLSHSHEAPLQFPAVFSNLITKLRIGYPLRPCRSAQPVLTPSTTSSPSQHILGDKLEASVLDKQLTLLLDCRNSDGGFGGAPGEPSQMVFTLQ